MPKEQLLRDIRARAIKMQLVLGEMYRDEKQHKNKVVSKNLSQTLDLLNDLVSDLGRIETTLTKEAGA